MKRYALAAVAVLALACFAWTATAAQTESNNEKKSTPHKPPPPTCTAERMTGFASKVWRLIYWERGTPERKAWQAYHRRLDCAPSARHRRVMAKRWNAARERFNDHRRRKFAQRKRQREQARYEDAVTPPGLPTLEAIAACESGGDPTAVSSNGAYRGKYQFSYETWASVGGSGDPAAAPEREQDERAAELYRRSGKSPWPVCGV